MALRWSRIIPVAFVMYTIAFVDRTNVSLALASISRDLHMDPAQAGAAAGVFFWGYFVLQLPGGYLASRWSPKRLIGVLLVAWALCSVATGLVHTRQQFYVARLLLGLAEGGVWPATLVLLANWFPRPERARANALWMMCLPVAMVVSSPFSGWILGRWGWRALVMSEGLLPVLWLAVWLRLADDRPRDARWISGEERRHLEVALARESLALRGTGRGAFWSALTRPAVLTLVGVAFLLYAGCYGYLFWFPTAIAASLGSMGRTASSSELGVWSALPYVLAAVAMVAVSRHSDQKLERRGHMAVALAWSGVCLLVPLATGSAPVLKLAALVLAAAGPLAALAPLYAIPAESLPPALAGSVMGLVCAVGNLGGYFGPLVVGRLIGSTGTTTAGFGVLGAGLLAGGTIALLLPARQGSWNLLQRTFIFVCSGNTSRSPIAQAICNAEIARRLKVPLNLLGEVGVQAMSAGLTAKPGAPLTAEAARALDQIGVPAFRHTARNLTADMVERAEAIFCMTESQRRAAVERFPQAAGKTHCLYPDGSLDDPTGGGPDVFLDLALRIQALVSRRLDEMGMVAV